MGLTSSFLEITETSLADASDMTYKYITETSPCCLGNLRKDIINLF